MLLSYAETDGHPIDDQLDRGTVEIVERLTGYDDVWQRNARRAPCSRSTSLSGIRKARATGLEPATSGVTGRKLTADRRADSWL